MLLRGAQLLARQVEWEAQRLQLGNGRRYRADRRSGFGVLDVHVVS
jgi:hypothetical protein